MKNINHILAKILIAHLIFCSSHLLAQSDVLIAACNAINDKVKRLECLREAIKSSNSSPDSQNTTSHKPSQKNTVSQDGNAPSELGAAELFAKAFEIMSTDKEKSIFLYSEGLRKDPGNIMAWRYINNLYEQIGDVEMAAKSSAKINDIASRTGAFPKFPPMKNGTQVSIPILTQLELKQFKIPQDLIVKATKKTYQGDHLFIRHSDGFDAYAIGNLIEMASHREGGYSRFLIKLNIRGKPFGNKGESFTIETSYQELGLRENTETSQSKTCTQLGAFSEVSYMGDMIDVIIMKCKYKYYVNKINSKHEGEKYLIYNIHAATFLSEGDVSGAQINVEDIIKIP